MGKQHHNSINSKSSHSDNPHRLASKVKGKGGNLRDKSTIARIKMYRGGRPVRNRQGKVIGGSFMMGDRAGDRPVGDVVRIAPDRRWFGNTHVIAQDELDRFREEMKVKSSDPYSVLLKRRKLPLSLLRESEDMAEMNLIEAEPYENTFGRRNTRNRPKMDESISDYASLLSSVNQKQNDFEERQEEAHSRMTEEDRFFNQAESNGSLLPKTNINAVKHPLFDKGQSRRIWSELFKVIDSSDVVMMVLDARNVPGTRCNAVESYVKKNCPHKHLVIVINKCDLVPSWVARKWVKRLSREIPTLAFHASITNSFGKGAMFNLLRQYAQLHKDRKQITVGIVGYPNTGKSSVINTLRKKKVVNTAPIPGETKVWQYVTLMKRIYLVDSPGVVPSSDDNDVESVLKGVVRSERLPDPTVYIQPILERIQEKHIRSAYALPPSLTWTDGESFLEVLAIRWGRLIKGGEADLHTTAVQVINDWQRGRLPFFIPPPREGENENRGFLLTPAASSSSSKEEEEDEEDETPMTEEAMEELNKETVAMEKQSLETNEEEEEEEEEEEDEQEVHVWDFGDDDDDEEDEEEEEDDEN